MYCNKEILSKEDRQLLRELAKEVAEIAADTIHTKNAKLWTQHNDLKTKKTMVLVFPEGCWRELIVDSDIKCNSSLGKSLEKAFRQQIYYSKHLQDDNPILNIFNVPISTQIIRKGLEENIVKTNNSTGADHFEQVINGMSDIEKIQKPEVIVDWGESRSNLEFYKTLFGDILDVRQHGTCYSWFAPIDDYAKLRGLDTIYYDMLDEPELINEFCRRTVDNNIFVAKELERQGALTLNLSNNYAGSGGNCYTNDLPSKEFDPNHIRTEDFWGFATAQMFSEVSPDMHEEFALKHEKRFLDIFGLNCYGCCEPLHNKLEMVINHIPRLRRVSISPWADIEKSAEILQDKYIYSWKPNPAILAGKTINPDSIRNEIKNFCEKTKGSITEIIMKDTHTIKNEPQRLSQWVKITKEVLSEYN